MCMPPKTEVCEVFDWVVVLSLEHRLFPAVAGQHIKRRKVTKMQHVIIKAQPPGRDLFLSHVACALYPLALLASAG